MTEQPTGVRNPTLSSRHAVRVIRHPKICCVEIDIEGNYNVDRLHCLHPAYVHNPDQDRFLAEQRLGINDAGSGREDDAGRMDEERQPQLTA